MKLSAVAVAVLLTAALTPGCGTIVPTNHPAAQIEFEGNNQNAGLVAIHYDIQGKQDGYIWSPKLVEKYHALLKNLGDSLWPVAPKEGEGISIITTGRYAGNYLVTIEVMQNLIVLVQENLRRGTN